jgi:uncharacterized protein with GYD domain
MARYLFHGTYSPEGIKGVLSEGGAGRRAAVDTAVQALGGRTESMYFGLGGNEVFVVLDLPDPAAATVIGSLTLSSGAFASGTATPVLAPDELDAALQQVERVTYRPPGA